MVDITQLKHGEKEFLALKRIDETALRLQNQGNYFEALDCMERGLVLRQYLFGSKSDELWQACSVVGQLCNLFAMKYINEPNNHFIIRLLLKAEVLTKYDQSGKATTYNNFACYYRSTGDLHKSLSYIQKAIKLEKSFDSLQKAADTHLNACVVFSQLGRHFMALKHAQNALIMLQDDMAQHICSKFFNTNTSKIHGDEQQFLQIKDSPSLKIKLDFLTIICIAHHNIGVEHEFLKQYSLSLNSYKKGKLIANNYLGSEHLITKTLRESVHSMESIISTKSFVV